MPEQAPVVLITGAARRIGACMARHMHARNYRVIVHYHASDAAAKALSNELNAQRKNSACAIGADLGDVSSVTGLVKAGMAQWDRIDALINNASSFYPTPLPTVTEAQWHDLMASNVQGPFFLCQALSTELSKRRGAIVNIADIHARQPLARHSVYCIAKAGNLMLTKAFARELAPHVRVNGIAPGVILWPEQGTTENSEKIQKNIVAEIPLKRMGEPDDIARLAEFFITNASYITGQTVAVDGGKHLT